MFAHRSELRRTEATLIRQEASKLADQYAYPSSINNGEEASYRTAGQLSYVANYSKGLRHNAFGEVLPASYASLLRALDSHDPNEFEQIQLGSPNGLNLVNPQAGLAFDLEGPDASALSIPPAPRIDQSEAASEMGELYWMALLRDVAFVDYGTGANTDNDPNINTTAAAASLTNEFSDFPGPRDAAGNVTPAKLFRGFTPGDSIGPFVSQFLLLGTADPILGPAASNGFIRYGTLRIDQRQKTAAHGVDYLTEFNKPGTLHWLGAQNGRDDRGSDQFDNQMRFTRNLRDLATYVHFDALYEAYLNACIIMLDIRAPFDPGNPYIRSRTQDGFGTFGGPHILSLVTEVATRALKAVWHQKWGVHRRLRPEEFGGRIHVHRNVAPRYPFINSEILNSNVINLVESRSGTALLPQAFPEGCPTHPSYGAGHATVAGACVTLLKAFFDESFPIPNPVQADRDGINLVALNLPVGTRLSVGNELNKLAANISIGRNAAGVHWRSDYRQSLLLGEEIALELLREQKLTYNEDHHMTVTRFDGNGIVI